MGGGGGGGGEGEGGGGVGALSCLYGLALLVFKAKLRLGIHYTAGFTSVDRLCWLNGTGRGLVLGLVPDSRIFGLIN